jgi:hypothetical protein
MYELDKVRKVMSNICEILLFAKMRAADRSMISDHSQFQNSGYFPTEIPEPFSISDLFGTRTSLAMRSVSHIRLGNRTQTKFYIRQSHISHMHRK